jgi:hypothetical protein
VLNNGKAKAIAMALIQVKFEAIPLPQGSVRTVITQSGQ